MKKFNNSYHSFHYLTPENTRFNRAPGNKFNLAIFVSPDGRRNSIVSLKKSLESLLYTVLRFYIIKEILITGVFRLEIAGIPGRYLKHNLGFQRDSTMYIKGLDYSLR